MGDNVIPFACDVSTAEGVETIFAKAEELFPKIDIFYANAGFPYYEQFDYTDWDRVENMGVRPVNGLAAALKGCLSNVYLAGDAVHSGRIADAVHGGYEAAMRVK